MNEPQRNFYVTGGTLQRDAPSYVQRKADTDLYQGLSVGNFCYVLTSRQMGKSSLMVRTAMRLRAEGVAVVVLDLTAVGQNVTVEQWYDGLLARVGQQLHLEDELEDFWLDKERLGPLQRWVQALRELVLNRCEGRVVIFIDEIDSVRSLPFSTDEFFAGIRELYNRRTEDPELQRLSFCLLGVVTPSDLIKDTRLTPFNIGQRIELTDFTDAEAGRLAEGLGRTPKLGAKLLERILYWTGGHPYLMQRLCQAVAQDQSVTGKSGVDRLCEELFLSSQARERDDNLLFVRDRILRAEVDRAGLLEMYAQVRNHKRVPDDEANPLISVLRLSGITRVVEGYLYVRNRIYDRVFDQEWVRTNMPDAELRRQQAAYNRGFVKAATGARTTQVALAALVIWIGLVLSLLPFKVDGSYSSYPYGVMTSLENSALDTLFQLRDVLHPELRARGQQEPITIIEIDEASIKASNIRPQSWPRSYYARLVDRAQKSGASIIGLDVYFSEEEGFSPEDKASDQELVDVLNESNVVIAKKLPEGGTPGISPLPMFADVSSAVGFADLPQDKDRFNRAAQLFPPGEGDAPSEFSFAATLAQIYADQPLNGVAGEDALTLGDRVIPLRPDLSFNIDFRRRSPGFRYISAGDILFNEGANIPDELFKDRIVLIGATNNDAPDLFSTPYYQPGVISSLLARLLGRPLETAPKLMPGVEIHANIVATMLFGKQLTRPRYLWQVFILGVPLLLAAFLLIWLRSFWGVLSVILLILIVLATAAWLFSAYGIILPLGSMCVGLGMIVFLGFVGRLSSKVKISVNRQEQNYLK